MIWSYLYALSQVSILESSSPPGFYQLEPDDSDEVEFDDADEVEPDDTEAVEFADMV
jgi:hypothetical protein